MLLPSRKAQTGRNGIYKGRISLLPLAQRMQTGQSDRSGPQSIQTHIILPAKNGVNGVSIACSDITIRNLTVKYAGNDGFNIHGHRRGIRLEHVRALSCADEGISAHETTEMKVLDSEIAWNGSISGGVTDVNDAVTSYHNCIVHDNAGAAFSFTGKAHRVYDSLIYNQEKSLLRPQGS